MLVGSEMFIKNPHERFPCSVCGKSYLRKRHLQRHMRDECIDIPPRFSCDLCPSRFRRKYHMVRHLVSKHGIPTAIAQQAPSNSGGAKGYRKSGENNVSYASSARNGNGAVPENLSLKRERYNSENMPHSPQAAAASQAHATNVAEVNGIGNIDANNQPIYGLTGAITAISAAAVMGESNGQAIEGINEEIARTLASNVSNDGATGQVAANKDLDVMGEEWKMKLGIQLISNTLLKERLINTIPYAYNNNK